MTLTEILLAAVCFLLLLVLVLLLRQGAGRQSEAELREALRRELKETAGELRTNMDAALRTVGDGTLRAVDVLGDVLQENQQHGLDKQEQSLAAMQERLTLQQDAVEGMTEARLLELKEQLALQREEMKNQRQELERQLAALREENTRQLAEIRGTVDEKLQTTLEKRIAESFRTVSERLEQVHQGLGEMQALASDVGGLKKVLAGVKTRGTLGEVQLGAILSEVLAPGQYEENVETVRGSGKRVEFALRLPGDGSGVVYLPVDAKFPGERYAQLQEARESGDKAAIAETGRELERVICAEAKDISEKYISPPQTTSFGIMFLPCEGLYLEVVNRGLVERLQRDYRVSVAGPSTMAAYLNSLQMGFRTLAIQQRSAEVWKVLAAVKTEFGKFTLTMEKMRRQLNTTSQSLDELMGARTKKLAESLKAVEHL